MSKRFLRTTSGFTLIELIVSVSILAMLSLAFLRQSEMASNRHRIQEYSNSIEIVMSYMRSARTNAITSKVFGAGTEQHVPPGGYGMYLEILEDGVPRSIRITEFVDNDEDGIYKPWEDNDSDGRYSDGDTGDISFQQQTIRSFWRTELLDPIDTDGVEASLGNDGKALTVIFLPGEAEMKINDNDEPTPTELRSVELVFDIDGRKKLICLHRVSRFIETVSERCS